MQMGMEARGWKMVTVFFLLVSTCPPPEEELFDTRQGGLRQKFETAVSGTKFTRISETKEAKE